MGLPFVPALEQPRLDENSQGLDWRILSYLGSVFTKVHVGNLDETFDLLHKALSELTVPLAVYLDVTALTAIEDVISLLDAGAAKVFISHDQLKELQEIGKPDADRIVLKNHSKSQESREQLKDGLGPDTIATYYEAVDDVDQVKAKLGKEGSGISSPSYFSLRTTEGHAYKQILSDPTKLPAISIIPASILTVDDNNESGKIPVHRLLQITSDRPDGLFPTVVTDERGIALGLVYSTIQSINQSLRTGRGVYHSRKRGLWYKGESSGDVQELLRIELDCDGDCLRFTVRQKGNGFCHLGTATCFGAYNGLARLQKTLQARRESAPEGSYTARLFSSPPLLRAKIMEEAEELCKADSQEEVAAEAADLIYFTLVKCIEKGVSIEDVERNLDGKSIKVKRRKGDAKGQWAQKEGLVNGEQRQGKTAAGASDSPASTDDQQKQDIKNDRVQMKRYETSEMSPEALQKILQRPSQRSTDAIMGIVKPILQAVRERGDAALLEYTHKFDKATSLTSTVLRAPFPSSLMQLPKETAEAIDVSFDNIYRFHAAQKEKPLSVETMPGVKCSRFSKAIERVGLYVPGGTAVLPSTALMLGVPALVAGCKKIVLASPPRPDGSVTAEIVYIAHKVGAESIVLAGGAQAVAALAYGTESVTKVDKILGPGNQFVTAAKMVVSNDTSAGVSIDMPAGPSEVLVVADATANPAFVASDLLSQAEHGVDSQVVLIAVALTEPQLAAIEDELHAQASQLPRVEIIRGAIEHSVTLLARDIDEALSLSNEYAPEHLILQVSRAHEALEKVENAGSVFVGPWTPESVGDYSAGVNHSLPTYGYARQYSGVSLSSYVKHMTSSELTAAGLRKLGATVMELAKVEGLEAHRRAVSIRLEEMDRRGE